MRSFDQLVALDFPHVAPEKFEEWKQAGIDSSNNQMSINSIYTGALIVIFFLYRASNYIPIFIIIAVVILLRMMVNTKFKQLSKELGITRDMIDKAMKTDSFEVSLIKPGKIETPNIVSASNLNTNVEIEKPNNDISEELLPIEEEQEEGMLNDSKQKD